MASELEALLLEVAVRPDDIGCRLVLADWLTERGDPRGEFIALQCKPSPSAADHRRAADLLGRHMLEWVSPEVRSVADLHSFVFERGFLVSCRLISPTAGGPARLASDWATVRRLANPSIELLDSCPLVSDFSEVEEHVAAAIVSGPARPHLRRMEVVSATGFELLTNSWREPRGIAGIEEVRLNSRSAATISPERLDPILISGLRHLKHLTLEAGFQRMHRWLPALVGTRLESFSLTAHRVPLDPNPYEAFARFHQDQQWALRVERDQLGRFSILRVRCNPRHRQTMDVTPLDFDGPPPPQAALDAIAFVLEHVPATTFGTVTWSSGLSNSDLKLIACIGER